MDCAATLDAPFDPPAKTRVGWEMAPWTTQRSRRVAQRLKLPPLPPPKPAFDHRSPPAEGSPFPFLG
jgi:hypothetical protein